MGHKTWVLNANVHRSNAQRAKKLKKPTTGGNVRTATVSVRMLGTWTVTVQMLVLGVQTPRGKLGRDS